MVSCTIALSYYSPYVSGLTNVARDIAEGLARRGHEVTVVANLHDAALPREEELNGVRVIRSPVQVRMGKGVLGAGYLGAVERAAKRSSVVNVHAPMLEAGPLMRRLASRTRAARALTYHCDIALPAGPVARVQQVLMDRSSRAAARDSDAVVVTTDDYADSSRIRDALSSRRVVIPPGCTDRAGGHPRFREGSGPHIGFLGRIVEEKGIEFLVDGFSALPDSNARLLIAGDFSSVAGGSVIDRVRRRIGDDHRIRLLGFLDDRDLPDFYASLDAFALTSVNSFEAFGIVQVEAMIAGVPSIASDLPGVREPVRQTGFGLIVPPRHAGAITEALHRIRHLGVDSDMVRRQALAAYGVEAVVDRYEELFERLTRGQRAT